MTLWVEDMNLLEVCGAEVGFFHKVSDAAHSSVIQCCRTKMGKKDL